MTTKAQKIAELKTAHPTISKGINDEVIELDAEEYEATIAAWAEVDLAKEAEEAAEAKKAVDRQVLLAKLGISEDEAKLLLG